MTTLRGIAQPSDCLLAHMLLAYWRELLVNSSLTSTGWFWKAASYSFIDDSPPFPVSALVSGLRYSQYMANFSS